VIGENEVPNALRDEDNRDGPTDLLRGSDPGGSTARHCMLG
jgi:hypothetical protein